METMQSEINPFVRGTLKLNDDEHAIIEKGQTFWRARGLMINPIEEEPDCVQLLELWDQTLMRQGVILELAQDHIFPEDPKKKAA